MWSHVKIDMHRSHFPSHVYMTRQNDQIEGEIQRPTKKRNSTIPTWLTFQIYALIHVGEFSTLHVARVERCKPIHKFHKHVSPTTQSHNQTHPTTMKNVIEVKISSICKSLILLERQAFRGVYSTPLLSPGTGGFEIYEMGICVRKILCWSLTMF